MGEHEPCVGEDLPGGAVGGAVAGVGGGPCYDRLMPPQRACLNGKRAFSGKFERAENYCFLSR